MIATEIQNEIFKYLCDTRGDDIANLFILDGLCGLTEFSCVQEHLLKIIPITEFKTPWILENDDFRSWCVRNIPVEYIQDEWLVLEEDEKIFLERRKDEKIIRTYMRDVNRNRRGVDRISRDEVTVDVVLHKKKELQACACGSEKFMESYSRFFCQQCGLEDLKNDHAGSPVYTSEIPVSDQSRTPSPPKDNTRLKSFTYFLRSWRGQGSHKADEDEMKLLHAEFPDPSQVSYSKLKLFLYKTRGLNHLYAGIYSLLRDLGRPRPNVDAVFDEIIQEFHDGGYDDEKAKLKNLEILNEILNKIGFVYDKDDEASLAKGRHFF